MIKKTMTCLVAAACLLIEQTGSARVPQPTGEISTVGWSETTSEDRRSLKSKSPDLKPTLITPFTPNSHNLGLDVGQVFLLGTLGSNFDHSLGAHLRYTYGVSDLFGFDFSIGVSQHSDGQLTMVPVLLGIRTNLAWFDKVIPYASLGLGFFHQTYKNNAITDQGKTLRIVNPISQLLFGLHGGLGFNLDINPNFYFGVAARPHLIFGANKTLNDHKVSFGGFFLSFLVQAGVTF